MLSLPLTGLLAHVLVTSHSPTTRHQCIKLYPWSRHDAVRVTFVPLLQAHANTNWKVSLVQSNTQMALCIMQ